MILHKAARQLLNCKFTEPFLGYRLHPEKLTENKRNAAI